MKKLLIALPFVLALAGCSRNPDPEYAPDSDDAEPAAAAVEAAPAAAPAPAAAAPVARLSEEETMRLGREAVALLFAGDIETLWTRFDERVKTQAGSVENFTQMTQQIFGQIGAEMNVTAEEYVVRDDQPGLAIYRRQGHYLAIGQDANLFVAFNADGTIAGINIQPAQ